MTFDPSDEGLAEVERAATAAREEVGALADPPPGEAVDDAVQRAAQNAVSAAAWSNLVGGANLDLVAAAVDTLDALLAECESVTG